MQGGSAAGSAVTLSFHNLCDLCTGTDFRKILKLERAQKPDIDIDLMRVQGISQEYVRHKYGVRACSDCMSLILLRRVQLSGCRTSHGHFTG